MSRPRTTYGKRDREQQKREKAKAKADRRAARQEAGSDDDSPIGGATEAELVERLAALHREFEAGDLPLVELEERQERLRTELQRIQR